MVSLFLVEKQNEIIRTRVWPCQSLVPCMYEPVFRWHETVLDDLYRVLFSTDFISSSLHFCRNLVHSSHTLCTLRYARYCTLWMDARLSGLSLSASWRRLARAKLRRWWRPSFIGKSPFLLQSQTRYATHAWMCPGGSSLVPEGGGGTPPVVLHNHLSLSSLHFLPQSHTSTRRHSCKEHILTACGSRKPDIEVMAL